MEVKQVDGICSTLTKLVGICEANDELVPLGEDCKGANILDTCTCPPLSTGTDPKAIPEEVQSIPLFIGLEVTV